RMVAGPRDERVGVVGVLGIVIPASRRPLRAEPEVPFVRSGSAELVDHATDGTAVLGAIARDESLLLLDRVVRQADAALIVEHGARKHAIDVILVFRSRSAAEGHGRRAQRAAHQYRRARLHA